MEVERDCAQHFFYINQIGYFKEILKCFRMDDYKTIEVSLDPKTKLKKNVNKDDEMVKVPYQQTVGSIAVKHILKYLQGTLQFKLHFGRLPPQELVGYCDADWAGDLEDKRSIAGFVFMIGGGAIF
jgi:hypothetical protein